MVHFSIAAETDMGPWCLHLPLTSCVPSISGAQLGMSREGAGCWMTSEGPAPLRHAPTLRGQQNTVQRESLGHQMAQCRSNVPPRGASIYRYGHYVTRAYLLKEVTVKEKK